jgi:hypothetical protein
LYFHNIKNPRACTHTAVPHKPKFSHFQILNSHDFSYAWSFYQLQDMTIYVAFNLVVRETHCRPASRGSNFLSVMTYQTAWCHNAEDHNANILLLVSSHL